MKPAYYSAALQQILLLITVLFMAGCGGSGSASLSERTAPTGSLSASLVWPESAPKAAVKSTLPAAVTTVRLIISGPGMQTIQRDFPASAGGAVIDGIPAGNNRMLTIQGLDSSGTVIYQADVQGISINAGGNTNLGSVPMQPVVPPAPEPEPEPEPEPPPTYTVTPQAGANGSISPATAQTISHGSSTSFTVTPAAGYAIDTVTGCGGSLSGSTYTTGAISGACTVSATFAAVPPVTHTVTPQAGANGSISPATAQTVNHGSSTSFTVTPAAGYAIASVNGCGGSLSGSTYTTGAVTGACTVTASFSLLTYGVTPSAGANGSISPATAQTVNHGSSTSFTITPAAGYAIATVSGCGGSLSGNTYTTGAITGACTVAATFASTTGSAEFSW